MSEKPSKPATGATTARRGCAFCLGLLLLLATPLLLVNGILNHRAAVELDTVRERLRASGAPLHLKDLAPPAAKPEENAATIYARALSAMSAPLTSDVEAALDLEPEPVPPVESVEAYLASQQPVIDDLRAAVALPRCDWQLDYSKGFTMMMPHLLKIRDAEKLMRLLAIRQAERGEGDAAADTLGVALRMNRALDEDPLLIGRLVQLAGERSIHAGMGRALAGRPSEAACRRLIAAIEAQRPRDQLARAFQGERAVTLSFIESLRERKPMDVGGGQDQELAQRWANAARLCPWLLDQDEVAYCGLLEGYVAAARKAGTRAALDEAMATEARARALPKIDVISRLLVPALGRTLEHELDAAAARESSRAAVAVVIYRARHGKWPDAIAELAPAILPEVPLDPWTEQPLRYKVEKGSIVVYSVGKDGRDDGGPLLEEERDSSPSRDDIGVRVR